MSHDSRNRDQERMIEEQDAQMMSGAPAGAEQNVGAETEQGAVSRPGGATQNSGGALGSNDEELGIGGERAG